MCSSFPAVQFPKLGHTFGALMRAALPYLLRGKFPPTSSQLQLPLAVTTVSSHSQLASAFATLILCYNSFFSLSTPITVYNSHSLLSTLLLSPASAVRSQAHLAIVYRLSRR